MAGVNQSAVRRWTRPVALGATLLILSFGGWIAIYRWGAVQRAGYVGVDFHWFLVYAQRWLDTGMWPHAATPPACRKGLTFSRPRHRRWDAYRSPCRSGRPGVTTSLSCGTLK
jgi:hypothetical protein